MQLLGEYQIIPGHFVWHGIKRVRKVLLFILVFNLNHKIVLVFKSLNNEENVYNVLQGRCEKTKSIIHDQSMPSSRNLEVI